MLTFSEMFDDLENEDEAFEDELEFENPGQNLTKESRRIFGFGSKVKKSMLFSYKKIQTFVKKNLGKLWKDSRNSLIKVKMNLGKLWKDSKNSLIKVDKNLGKLWKDYKDSLIKEMDSIKSHDIENDTVKSHDLEKDTVKSHDLDKDIVNSYDEENTSLIKVMDSIKSPDYDYDEEDISLFAGGCCRSVRVTYVNPYYNTGAHALLKNRIYKNFRKQWGNLNGSPYYRNGNYGIWNCGRGWYIGEIRYRGQCSGLAANNIRNQCPPRSSNRNWIYRNRGTWQNAGRSLVIVC